MENINVLSIVPYNFLPPKMGGQKGIAFFNRYLSKKLNIICIGTKDNKPTQHDTYNVIPFFSDSFIRYINIFNFFSIQKIIKQKNITHVILEHPYLGWLGFMLMHFCKVKIIIHSHNIEALRFKTIKKWWWKILWQYEKWVYKYANYVFFITNEDRTYAIKKMNVKEEKTKTITYGIDIANLPSIEDRMNARKKLLELHNIKSSEKILLFNGTLNYNPNLLAIDAILQRINPILLKHKIDYKIIICGKNLPLNYNKLEGYENIIYAGFVEDINIYFLGADIFINPVEEGGGIKTKLVEALGFNLSSVSFSSGAIGIPIEISKGKLEITNNNDWELFCEKIIKINTALNTDEDFYKYFYWEEIAAKAARVIIKL